MYLNNHYYTLYIIRMRRPVLLNVTMKIHFRRHCELNFYDDYWMFFMKCITSGFCLSISFWMHYGLISESDEYFQGYCWVLYICYILKFRTLDGFAIKTPTNDKLGLDDWKLCESFNVQKLIYLYILHIHSKWWSESLSIALKVWSGDNLILLSFVCLI